MNKIQKWLSGTGEYSSLHILAVSTILTGVFVVYTASAFGPIASFVIAVGAYFSIFGLIIETLIATRVAIRWLVMSHLRIKGR